MQFFAELQKCERFVNRHVFPYDYNCKNNTYFVTHIYKLITLYYEENIFTYDPLRSVCIGFMSA